MALCLFVCQQATKIGVGGLHRPGPGLLAFGVGAGTGLLVLAVFIRSLLSKPAIEAAHDERTFAEENFF